MWVFDRWSPYSYQNNMEKYRNDDERRYFNLKECLWFCMTSLTPQVCEKHTSKLRVFINMSFREEVKLPRTCLVVW